MKRAHYLRRERFRNRWRRLKRRVRLKRYDPSRVSVSFNGVELIGWSGDTLNTRPIISDEEAFKRTGSSAFGIETMLKSFTLSAIERTIYPHGYDSEEIKLINSAARVVFSLYTFRGIPTDLRRFIHRLNEEIWSQLEQESP